MKCQVCDKEIASGEPKRQLACSTPGCKIKAFIHIACVEALNGRPTYCGRCLTLSSAKPATFVPCQMCCAPLPVQAAVPCACPKCEREGLAHEHCARGRLQPCVACCALELSKKDELGPAICVDLQHVIVDPACCPSCCLTYVGRRTSELAPMSIDAHNVIARENVRGESAQSGKMSFALKTHEWMCEFYAFCSNSDAFARARSVMACCETNYPLDLVVDTFLDDTIETGAPVVLMDSARLIAQLMHLNRVRIVPIDTDPNVMFAADTYRTRVVGINSLHLATLFGEGALMDARFCQAIVGTSQCQVCESIQAGFSLLARYRLTRIQLAASWGAVSVTDNDKAMVFIGRQFCCDRRGTPVASIAQVDPYYLVSVTIWQIERHLEFYRSVLLRSLFNLSNTPTPHVETLLLQLWPVFRGFYVLKMLETCCEVDVSETVAGTTTKVLLRKAFE